MRIIIMRGVSGSGKSTYTKKYYPDAVVCSADDYFIEPVTLKYDFKPALIGEAHKWCMHKFVEYATRPVESQPEVVVVDNTHTMLWEFSGYVQVAEAYGHSVEIVRMETPVAVCAARNTHGVPAKAVESMAQRFQKCLPWWKETVVSGIA